MSNRVSFDQRLRAIGFRISYAAVDVPLGVSEQLECDIERTLLDALDRAHVENDGRLRSLIFSWFAVHHDRLVIEKFFKLSKNIIPKHGSNPLTNAIAVYGVILGTHAFRRYIERTPENEFLLSKDESESFAQIQGYKEDWLKYGVKVPAKMIRIRTDDALTESELARINLQYRNRLLIGTSWRADIVTAIQLGARTPAEVVRQIGCSYEPAHRVFREYCVYSGTATAKRAKGVA